jgi:hypothetical protein
MLTVLQVLKSGRALGPGKYVCPDGWLTLRSECWSCSAPLNEHDDEGNCPRAGEEDVA